MSYRPYHHGDLRAALLAGAERMLCNQGSPELSLRQISREVGVSHAASARHFRSKQALLDALAATGYQRLTQTMEAADDPSLGFPQRLAALNRAVLRFATDNTALLGLMSIRTYDTKPGEELAAAVDRAAAVIRQLIEDAQQRGEVIEGDPDRIALLPAAALHGLAFLVANGSLASHAALDQLDQLVHSMLYGLTSR
ncbi:TetR/AcrR family transcriptional regulator [Streptomyces sp. NPDC005486]|uniref:TetR/AcrR family transcriptional regulator n=1 Tax=Streptomyces sp. NPDC005486 TaxID=3155345 RepID=UPI0033A82FC3